jgi:predicted transcriptional regulator
MTVKDELHALVDRLPDQDAQDALEYLRARIDLLPPPSRAFIDECRRALDEAAAPRAALVPHEAVRAWLLTWGTPEEEAADAALQALEERLRRDAQAGST